MSNSTGYTSHCPGNSGGGEGVDAGEQEEKMENFLLGSGWVRTSYFVDSSNTVLTACLLS